MTVTHYNAQHWLKHAVNRQRSNKHNFFSRTGTFDNPRMSKVDHRNKV